MKTNTAIISTIVVAALTACLMCALAPAAFAADSTLTAGKTALTTQSATKKATPKLKAVSKVKVTLTNGRTYYEKWVKNSQTEHLRSILSWKAPKKVKGLKKQTYSVRYVNGYGDPFYGKIKTTTKTSFKLPAFEDGFGTVQIRVNARYGKKTVVHSPWVTYTVSAGAYSSRGTNSSGSWMYLKKYEASIESDDVGKAGSWEESKKSRAPRSIKLASTSPGSVKVSWKEPKTIGSDDSPIPKYAVKYSYNKSMKNAKYKYDIEDESVVLKKLRKGKKLYVSVAAEALYQNIFGGSRYEIVSRWTTPKAITISKKATAPANQTPVS